jgi:hypothetical protein
MIICHLIAMYWGSAVGDFWIICYRNGESIIKVNFRQNFTINKGRTSLFVLEAGVWQGDLIQSSIPV